MHTDLIGLLSPYNNVRNYWTYFTNNKLFSEINVTNEEYIITYGSFSKLKMAVYIGTTVMCFTALRISY